LVMAIDKFKDYFNLKTSPITENQYVEFDMENAIQEYDDVINNL